MSSTAFSNTCVSLTLLGVLAGCAAQPEQDSLPAGVLRDLRHWIVEAEQPAARTYLRDGVLDIDSPAGITLWLNHELSGPVEISFDATAVAAGGANDQVSDLNVFWMAHNRDGSSPFTKPRSGKFSDYDDLQTYYVGLGGNRNTTTRFRRYIGEPGNRPLLPEHDLSAPDSLLVANRRQTITLVADGAHVEYRRDGKVLFVYEDDAPYTRGWFALRTTFSHLRIEHLRIRRPTD
jgi:hypothetical protein